MHPHRNNIQHDMFVVVTIFVMDIFHDKEPSSPFRIEVGDANTISTKSSSTISKAKNTSFDRYLLFFFLKKEENRPRQLIS